MSLYCLKCREKTRSKNLKVVKTKYGRIMLLSKCAMRDSKKSSLIKEQEANGLLSSLEIRTPLSSSSFVLRVESIKYVDTRFKMNEIVNKFLLAWDKFMPEMHLKNGYT